MNFSDKYKYLFMLYVYEKGMLKKIDDTMITNQVGSLELKNGISNYFELLNDVYEDRLSGQLKEEYDYYMSMDLQELISNNLKDRVQDFLERTYKLLLFPDLSNKFYYYGPININYVAPSDSIVLGFYYNEFETEETFSVEKHNRNEEIICDSLNYIQEKIGPSIGKKIAVIKFNEISKKKNNSRR